MSGIIQSAEPSSPHAVAVAHLLADHGDMAIAQLTLIAKESVDAAKWNDLGAAQYDAAVRSGSPEQLKDALAAVDQALLFDPVFSEALFNRALILEHFFLRDVAASAWRGFLARAGFDGWRDEAQRHLDALTAPRRTFATEIKSQYPRLQAGDRSAARDLLSLDAGDARYFTETEGLARWGEAWLRNDATADKHLSAMRTLSAELKAFSGEALLHESVAAIERASDAQRDALARGHVGCRDGRRAFDQRKMAEAEQTLNDAARELASGASPFANQVRLYAAGARFWQGRHAEAEADFRALRPIVPEQYAALRANVEWQLAACFMARADNTNSLSHLTRAIEILTRLRETNNVAYLHDIMSQVYDGIRDHERAEHHRALALRDLGRTADSRLAHAITGMTYAALERKQWRVARSFLTVQLAVNAKGNDAEIQITALLRRARLHSQLGDQTAAESDLRAARAIVATVPDPAHRTKLQIDCETETALLSNDPRTAIDLLTNVLNFQDEKGWRQLMPEMYLRRGRMHLALGDHVRAASDFETGIALLESLRDTIQQGEQRWGILDAAEELFDEAIAEALRNGAEPAFQYAERKRARSLSDALLQNLRVFDRALLPPDALLVEYAALPERLLIFVVDRNGFDVREVAISRAQLTTLAEQFAAALRNRDATQRKKLATRLYELLLAPIRPSIAVHREVAFVTDAATSSIAFAALPGAAPDRMLVEDVTISVAPSARLYVAARTRGARARSNVLIVDDPENDILERLAGTNDEAEAVQAVYPQVRRLSGRDATRAAFTRESRGANIIHFAGHGVSSIESASLVLTATADDSGLFDAASISRLSLRNTDVVVLAACDTARGPIRSAEGVLSVTHAFLQAGAPTVIATLWPLEDREAAAFFPRLHRHLAAGLPASEALRLAQLESIRSSPEDRSSLWAAVQTIGY
ncbi:MAG TPA: CHAT domain-containing protein [Thermoanaerobaculia bacterium]|nr:CHAT domain-containing protein [Thermoanaerobaculia bacterium]